LLSAVFFGFAFCSCSVLGSFMGPFLLLPDRARTSGFFSGGVGGEAPDVIPTPDGWGREGGLPFPAGGCPPAMLAVRLLVGSAPSLDR
jgi:hypothetical protein